MAVLALSFLLTGTDSGWNEEDRFRLLVGHNPSDRPLLAGPLVSADVSRAGVVEAEEAVEEEGVEGRLSADWDRLGKEEVAIVGFWVAFGDGYLLGVLGVEGASGLLLEITSFVRGLRIGLLAFLFRGESDFNFREELRGSTLQPSINFFFQTKPHW